MKIVYNLVAASKKPLSKKNQIVVRVLPVLVFFFFFPGLLFIFPKFVFDKWLQLPTLSNLPIRIISGWILITLGLFFLVSSTKAQREIDKGTPIPLKATQKLVVEKPYSYFRNPLYFGLISFFFGISIMIGSISPLVMVSIFSATILVYIKFIEEQELEMRYGVEYLAYKKITPLLIPIPSFFRRNKK